jgi:CBS domain-containing protein
MSPNADTVDASLPLDQVVPLMMGQNRRWAPVVDDGRYIGLIAVSDIAARPMEVWSALTARDAARTDVLPVSPATPLARVAERLRAAPGTEGMSGVGAIAVTDGERVVGVITQRDVANVEVLLDHLENQTT